MKPDRAWTLTAADAGVRLDKWLAAASRLGARGRATDAIAHGKVFLNDQEATFEDAGRRLSPGDRVAVWMDRPGSSVATRPRRRAGHDLHILFEDDELIVVDKPAGLLAVPLAARDNAPALSDLVGEYLRPRGRRRPLVVHRIDRDTSGVVVFARTARAYASLKAQFAERTPERVYRAIVYGRPQPADGTWRDRLAWNRQMLRQEEAADSVRQGAEAISVYRTIEAFDRAALLEVRLVTGKRNQIRIQASLHGHPLVGERQYLADVPASPIDFPRQALHAFRLTVRHPRTGRAIRCEGPMPADMDALLASLRVGGGGRSRAPRRASATSTGDGTKIESGG
jgi:23S rRNA pseudouridine1911/1915/1917 synthase